MIYDNPPILVTSLIILIKHVKWSISSFPPIGHDDRHRSALLSAKVLWWPDCKFGIFPRILFSQIALKYIHVFEELKFRD